MSAPSPPTPGGPPQAVDASPARAQSVPSQSPKRTRYQAPSRTYTIVQQEDEDPYARRRHATAPYVFHVGAVRPLVLILHRPKVWSTKELEAMKRAAQAKFKMYEAVPSGAGNKPGAEPMDADEEIEKFLPLLKDYLNGTRVDHMCISLLADCYVSVRAAATTGEGR